MRHFISGLVAVGIIFGAMWLINWLSAPGNNITCKQQVGGQFALCVSGQPGYVYVPFSTWYRAQVGGYYDKGTRTAYRTVNDDPHVSHGLFGGGEEEGHTSGYHFSGHE